MKGYKPVIVDAIDWHLLRGEYHTNDTMDVAKCSICGWLIEKTKNKIVIAQEHFHQDDNIREVLVIPVSCVLEIKYLRKR